MSNQLNVVAGTLALWLGMTTLGASEGPSTGPTGADNRFDGHPSVRWEATGRFRLAGHEGRHWLVAPDGRPFFYLGINHVGAGLSPAEREDRVFGAAYAERLRDAGFNGAGYGPPPMVWDHMPFIALLNLAPTSRFLRDKVVFPDVFDPEFQALLRQRVLHQCRTFRDNPNLVGYMWTDTPMWDLDNARRLRGRDWVSTLRASPGHAAGKTAYIGFLLERHGHDVARIAALYGIVAATRDDLLASDFARTDLSNPQVRSDDDVFLGRVAETLYDVAAAALREGDPRHLLLGEMYFQNDHPSEVLAAAARHVDVLVIQPSINHRAKSPGDHFDRALFDRLYRTCGKPILIGDHQFAYVTPEFPRTMWANFPSPREAADAYAAFLSAAIDTPYVIGYGRCQLRDAPQSDGSLKQGIWGQDGTPHADFAPRIAEANRRTLETAYGRVRPPR